VFAGLTDRSAPPGAPEAAEPPIKEVTLRAGDATVAMTQGYPRASAV
jgi:hypothetical protein